MCLVLTGLCGAQHHHESLCQHCCWLRLRSDVRHAPWRWTLPNLSLLCRCAPKLSLSSQHPDESLPDVQVCTAGSVFNSSTLMDQYSNSTGTVSLVLPVNSTSTAVSVAWHNSEPALNTASSLWELAVLPVALTQPEHEH